MSLRIGGAVIACSFALMFMAGCFDDSAFPYGGEKRIEGRIATASFGDNSDYRTPQNPDPSRPADRFTLRVAVNALNQVEPEGATCWWAFLYINEANHPVAYGDLSDAHDAGAGLTGGFVAFRGLTIEADGTLEHIELVELVDLDSTEAGKKRALDTCG